MEYYGNLFYNGKYRQLIYEVEEMLSEPGYGISDELLHLYTESLIRRGKFDEAIKNVEFMKKYYPNDNYCSDLGLLNKYARCKRVDKIKEILSRTKIDGDDLLKIANILYCNDELEYARELFLMMDNNHMFMEGTKNYNIVKSSLDLIDKFMIYSKEHPEQISKQAFSCFLHNGYKLAPGVVIFLWNKEKSRGITENAKITKKYTRPYMIWKIDRNKIYAFAITTKLTKYQYTFESGKYGYQHPDRRLKDRLICINESDISNVEEIIYPSDFDKAIDMMYYSIKVNTDEVKMQPYKYFVDSIQKDIKIKKRKK